MSVKDNRIALRAVVIQMLNSGLSEPTIRTIIATLTDEVLNPNSPHSLTERQVDNVFRSIDHCDTACGFGPGHQSTVFCSIRGPHTYHYNGETQYHLEWTERDITTQTHTDRRTGKVYRLAFSDEGWY